MENLTIIRTRHFNIEVSKNEQGFGVLKLITKSGDVIADNLVITQGGAYELSDGFNEISERLSVGYIQTEFNESAPLTMELLKKIASEEAQKLKLELGL